MIKKLSLGFLLILFLISCNDESELTSEHQLFQVKKSAETNISFANQLSENQNLNIVEYLYYYNGGGVAIGDIDNDGLEDIFFAANQAPDKLYKNKGGLQFEDITEASGITTSTSWSSGVTMDDINGDGYLDIYICKVSPLNPSGKSHNLLYINDGKGNFTEQSKKYGLDFAGFSTQSCFLDYDKDGDLDMYLLNHSVHSIRSYGSIENRKLKDSLSGDVFYENRIKEEGKFVAVTESAGIYSSPLGYGLAISAADVNNDGWTDIYVGNDFHENDYLYLNTGKKSFVESIKTVFPSTSQFSMGVDICDMNNDGWNDIFTTDMMPNDSKIMMKSAGEDSDQVKKIKNNLGFENQNARNHFQINDQNGSFSEASFITQTFASDWSWSVLLADFNNDTQSDIYITNGIVRRPNDLDYINYLNSNQEKSDFTSFIKNMPSQPLRNILYLQEEAFHFSKSNDQLSTPKTFSTGAAYSDLDNDGDLDIVINNINEEAHVIENTASENGNFLTIKLKGSDEMPIVKGSVAKLFSGGKMLTRELQNTKGFQSCSTPKIHFGLGQLEVIDSVHIIWPDGQLEKQSAISINKEMVITRAKSSSHAEPLTGANPLESKGLILPFKHEENNYYDEDSEKLIPERLSYEGPALLCEDLNNDGYVDIYLGGARNQKATLLMGNAQGGFDEKKTIDFESDAKYEDIDAAVIDFDGDGDKDLYVVSGGNDNKELDKLLEDRIYLNNGSGNFKRIPISLPHTNGSCVAISDMDGDGFEDIFLGARSIPGSYGLSPYSFILKNIKGQGVDIAFKERLGMITDGQWGDLDNDGDEDLVICGDWMNIRVLLNENGTLEEATSKYNLKNTEGLWNTITLHDLDQDGNLDILAGNQGSNFKWTASDTTPIQLYLGDFDKNGSSDPIIFYAYFGKYIPFGSLDKLGSQLPFLKKRFTTYDAFSEVTELNQLIENGEEALIETKYIHELRSMVYYQKDQSFQGVPLQFEEQLSAINDFAIDSNNNILYVGNSASQVAELGYSLSNPGRVIFNEEGKQSYSQSTSLNLPKKVVGRKITQFKDGQFIVVTNNDYVYIINKEEYKQIK